VSCVEGHMKESLKDHVLEQVLDAEKFKAFYLKPEGKTRMMSTMIIFSPEGIVLLGDLSPSRYGNVSALGYGLSWFSKNLSETYLCEKFLEKGWHQDLAVSDLKTMARDVLRGHYDQSMWTRELYYAWELRAGLLDDVRSVRKSLKHAKESAPDEVEDGKAEVVRRRGMLGEARADLRKQRAELADKLTDLANRMDDLAQSEFIDEYREIDKSDDWHDGLPGYGYKPSEAGWLCAIQQKFSELWKKAHPEFDAGVA